MEFDYTQDDIEAFVQGKMPLEERKVFVQKMKADPVFADAVADAQFAFDAGLELLKRDLRKNLQNWAEEKKTPNSPDLPADSSATGSARFKNRIWISAALLLLSVVVAVFVLPNVDTPVGSPSIPSPAPGGSSPAVRPEAPPVSSPNGPSPIAETPKTLPISPDADRARLAMGELRLERGDDKATLKRGNTETGMDTLERGDDLIRQHKYREGIQLLQTIPATREEYWSAQMYIGDGRFFQKQYAEAERAYLSVLRQGEPYSSAVFWRLASVYCAQYKYMALKNHLKEILDKPSHPDYDRAVRLLGVTLR